MRKHSIQGFKDKRASLHFWSPYIFLGCCAASIIIVAIVLHTPFSVDHSLRRTAEKRTPPVYMTVIPPTQQVQRVTTPPPEKPYAAHGQPVEVSLDMEPDTVTIEDTTTVRTLSPPVDETPNASGPAETGPSVYSAETVEEPPRRLFSPMPEYPRNARRIGIEGTVSLLVLVNAEGAVDSVEVIGGPELFHSAARQAARESMFEPAEQNGHPVPCWVSMSYRFALE